MKRFSSSLLWVLVLVGSFIVWSGPPACAQSSFDSPQRGQPDRSIRSPSQVPGGAGLPDWAAPEAPARTLGRPVAPSGPVMNMAPVVPAPPDQGSGGGGGGDGGGGGGGGSGTPIPVDGGLGLLAAAGAAYAASRLREKSDSDDETDDAL